MTLSPSAQPPLPDTAPGPMARGLAGLGLTLLLAGCASGPSIFVNEDPGAAFSGYRTYGFAEPLGTDRPEYSSLLSQYLRTAAARELEARGYRPGDEPDLLVNFYLETKEKIRSTSSPSPGVSFGGYYGYRRGYYGVWSGYETTVSQYTEGTLNVDVVDRERKQLVWEATVVGRIRDADREDVQGTVDSVMAQVFSRFPHRAPGTAPAAPPAVP